MSAAVERHHADDADGSSAVIRLADMLAHEARGDAVDPKRFAAAGEAIGVKTADLRDLTYKQIAIDLQVSESTVRSHLHKTYERLGVVDRAQAVLLAQDRGWI